MCQRREQKKKARKCGLGYLQVLLGNVKTIAVREAPTAWLTRRVGAGEHWDAHPSWLAVIDGLSVCYPSPSQQLLLGTETLPSFLYGETLT